MSFVVESKTRDLKPEQREAAHTLDRHVSVTAGPGAGKTTVLVERYLHILRTRDVSVDQIVAITFTNRAANEMRERLRDELDKLLMSAAPPDRSRWMRHKRTLDGAIITTIHGFCARLLREFPVEADIDPQFILLDAHRSAMLEETVVEEALTELISAGHQAVTELTAGIGRVRLARGLIEIYRSMRNQGLTTGKLAAKIEHSHKTIADYRAALDELAVRMSEFIRARRLSAATDDKRREAERLWPALSDLLFAAPDSRSPAEFCGAIQEFRDRARPRAQGTIVGLVEALDELIWEDKLGGRVPQILLDLSARGLASELIKVVEGIERRLDEQKRSQGALDFDDLQLRALRLLEEHPGVIRRMAGRYRFFLVDEFQDTNGLQRDLLVRLALGGTESGADFSLQGSEDTEFKEHRLKSVSPANLFIVGDRKQSIYGFRGADVDVFREMTARIETRDGLSISLNRNFRSQAPLIGFFNCLFARIFEHDGTLDQGELNELGYVEHESSVAARESPDGQPLVELLIDLRLPEADEDRWSQESPRERDAEQLTRRIISMVGTQPISRAAHSDNRKIECRDISLLFRAMTEVHIYESALRRAGVPYVTVDGKGFYTREEITDFIQLLRFLDNKTDEVALAAVLRSPICGLSDNALLALRLAPGAMDSGVRPLLEALRQHELIEFIDPTEAPALDRARNLLEELIAVAGRSRLSELLRSAVEASEYRTVAAAHFDGARRLANIEKLFTLAERFERSGAYLIRDFVRFVMEFEEAGGRESEGQVDDSANVVRLMSIHQSKGLEFPVVMIPDLHRQPDMPRDWWALDRHRGLTLKVPDGRGRLVMGHTLRTFVERRKRREQFESMRLLYVAATRAQDRLILSGAAKDLSSLRNSWLGWISKALGINRAENGVLKLQDADVEVRLMFNLLDTPNSSSDRVENVARSYGDADLPAPDDFAFPLLDALETERATGLGGFSVTQVLNYGRCPRQYYFDRVLYTPSQEEVAVWNNADAPEPPANLTATLRGAVIHRFCEKYREGDEIHDSLKSSLEDVLRHRAAELAERVLEIDPEKAIIDVLPLAENYVASRVRQRVEEAREATHHSSLVTPNFPAGVFSEQRFRLRRPLGILTGTIDKLLVTPSPTGDGVCVEIIDFKTNRLRRRTSTAPVNHVEGQLSFSFLQASSKADDDLLMRTEIQVAAIDYQIQMQAYALAARELIPEIATVRVTLHFLDPDIELSLPEQLLERDACAMAIDEALMNIVSSSAPESFPACPADHCRACSFAPLCSPGRQWLATSQ